VRIFIGYDSKEPVAYNVLAHSLIRHSSIPLSIAPIKLEQLRGVYTRERGSLESTEFSISRFMTPYLSNYTGWSLFMDCDMLCKVDIAELYPCMKGLCEDDSSVQRYAAMVCKHNYSPATDTKFLGQIQTSYPKKNWSSFMLLNNERCKVLGPSYVNQASGLDLHRFNWLDENEVGGLPLEWNWLVGDYVYNPSAKIVHYTQGGPWFEEYENCEYSEEWFEEYERMTGQSYKKKSSIYEHINSRYEDEESRRVYR